MRVLGATFGLIPDRSLLVTQAAPSTSKLQVTWKGDSLYRTIDAAFWTDPKVRSLSPDGRLLFLYLITNPHTHVSGIYYLPRNVMAHETGLIPKTVNTLCDTLSSAGFCGFDVQRELVWVKNMMKYQGRGEKNLKSAAHHIIEDLHNSPLIVDFAASYPEIRSLIPDRVYDRVSSAGTPDSLIPIPDSLTQIPEQEQDISRGLKNAATRPADAAYEVFADKHRETTGTAYMSKTADFVQLSKLRKANQIESRGTPVKWADAVENYFASPLAAFSLADLCSRFAVFCNSPVDRYHKPVNHRGNGNGKHNDPEDIARYNREGAIEFDKQLFGADWDGTEPEGH